MLKLYLKTMSKIIFINIELITNLRQSIFVNKLFQKYKLM